MAKLKKDILCAFEGIDGSGKSTVLRYISQRLTSLGYEVLIGTARNQSDEETHESIKQTISHNHGSEKVLLLEKYYYPQIYQAATSTSLDEMSFSKSDLVLVFDLPAYYAIKRIKTVDDDQFDEMVDLLEKVRNYYLQFKEAPNVCIINANRPIALVQDDAFHAILGHLYRQENN